MTPEDDVLRETLRDLIPDYRPPGDPFARVTASIRRRRARRRVLLAVGSAASVAAIAAAVPTLIGVGRPVASHDSGGPARGGGPGQTERPSAPLPSHRLYPVAAATVHGAGWSVGSIRLSDQARRCLYGNDKAIFDRAAWCFDDWRPGQSVTWGEVHALHPGANVTAVFGVASESVTRVEVVFSDGQQRAARVATTPTDPHARFFALVVGQPGLQVTSMASIGLDDVVVDAFVLRPASGQACPVGPDPVCGTPPP